jgi:peptidoglycan/LPS O-acetylase OafA/YrhL
LNQVSSAAADAGTLFREQSASPSTDDGAKSETRAAGERFYRPEIDGLRFFAFFAVYFRHTIGFGISGTHHHVPNWLGDLVGAASIAGDFGVDLFFVLSSYLITELLTRERAVRGALDVRAFYIRRILRIWPLYFFFIAVAVVTTALVPTEQLSWRHVAGLLLFAGNWVFMFWPVTSVAVPLWSIAIEEQFYICWPWVVRGLSTRGVGLCALALMIIGLVATAALGTWYPNADWVSRNSVTRLDGIAVGALLAVVLQGRMPKLTGSARVAIMVGCLAILMWIAYDFGLFVRPVGMLALVTGWPLAALACGGILYSVLGSSGWLSAPLRSRPMVYLGRISYGLYVWHELSILIGDHLFPKYNESSSQMLGRFVFGLALTVPIAAASYQFLEMPFLRLKRRRFTVVPSRPD